MPKSFEKHKELINILVDCVAKCNYCAMSCMEKHDSTMLEKCTKLCDDCAEICTLTISFLCRDSESLDYILEECAKICEKCADECEKHRQFESCKYCAEVSRKCSEACRYNEKENLFY